MERRVLEVCPSCFSTRHEVRGYCPDLSQPMAGAMTWPECRDPWHEEKRDGLKVAFDQFHYVQETGEFRPGAPEGNELTKKSQVLFVCPGDGCRFVALEAGKCRSHPYPCRAMGPELVPVRVTFTREAEI